MKWFKCCHCGLEKSQDNFYKDKQKVTGFKPRCKSCEKSYIDLDNRKNYERIYRENNKEKRAAIVNKSMQKNIEHHKQIRKLYLKTEAGIASFRKYTQTRYARMKNAFVESIKPIDVYQAQSGICYLCGLFFDFKQMELDHVMPIALGGLHELSNVKMACTHCNRSKGAKLPKGVCYQMV